MNGRTTRGLWTVHRWTGLVVCLNLALLSLTGVLLVFRSELVRPAQLGGGAAARRARGVRAGDAARAVG
ncbi:MAG: PepSY domain-containing protein, partial [Myxococcota bacterium]